MSNNDVSSVQFFTQVGELEASIQQERQKYVREKALHDAVKIELEQLQEAKCAVDHEAEALRRQNNELRAAQKEQSDTIRELKSAIHHEKQHRQMVIKDTEKKNEEWKSARAALLQHTKTVNERLEKYHEMLSRSTVLREAAKYEDEIAELNKKLADQAATLQKLQAEVHIKRERAAASATQPEIGPTGDGAAGDLPAALEHIRQMEEYADKVEEQARMFEAALIDACEYIRQHVPANASGGKSFPEPYTFCERARNRVAPGAALAPSSEGLDSRSPHDRNP